jgi:CheY-like chemotaxis protein
MNPDSPISRKLVLVISNEPTMRDVVERLLNIDGHLILTATTIEEGLAMAQRFPLDLILLNVRREGDDAAARLKLKDEPTTAKLPVILLSGFLRAADLKQIAIGQDSVFAMPLSLTEVRQAVNRLLNSSPGTDPSQPAP